MRDHHLNLIQMEIDRHSTQEVAPSQLAHQIESIAAASRNLETALLRERNYSKQLREYANQVIAQFHAVQKQERDLSDRLKELLANGENNSQKIQALTSELEKTRQELNQYRHAWSQVLAREKHAQLILSRGETMTKRIGELENALAALEKKFEAEKTGREKAENHASTHRQELQTTLVRLHSSEARYNDMARELEAIHTLRKNHALELARVEQVAREKLEAQFACEREQLLHEISRERDEYSRNRAEFERARTESSQALERLRREMELKLSTEVQRAKAQAEAQVERSQQRASEAHDGEIEKLESIIRTLGEQSRALGDELSQARAEAAAIDQSSRQLELDLLRSREEVAALQKQLAEERAHATALEQAVHAAEKVAEKAKSEIEEQRDRFSFSTLEMCELIQSDRKQMKALIEKLIDAWGSEDQALRDALAALRDACEIRTIRTDAPVAKIDLVTTSGPRLNC